MTATHFRIYVENVGVADCNMDERVLVALERAQGLGRLSPLPYKLPVGCRRGGCGVCKARIVTGEFLRTPMSRSHISIDDEQAGLILSCSIYPRSDLLLKLECSTKSGAKGKKIISNEEEIQ